MKLNLVQLIICIPSSVLEDDSIYYTHDFVLMDEYVLRLSVNVTLSSNNLDSGELYCNKQLLRAKDRLIQLLPNNHLVYLTTNLTYDHYYDC